MFQGIVTKKIEDWKQVFIDFSKTMFLLYLVYILFTVTIMNLPDNVELILCLIIYFLTISVTVFITVRYAGNGNAIFAAAALGVAPLTFLPFLFLAFFTSVFTLLYGWTGFTMLKMG
ncbi:hypothetical protein [Salinicoccus sp. Marseille-QA3877]